MKKILDGPLQPGEVMEFGGQSFRIDGVKEMQSVTVEFQVWVYGEEKPVLHLFDRKEDADEFHVANQGSSAPTPIFHHRRLDS